MKREEFLPLAISFGVLIGVMTDNIALWLAIGTAIGAALGKTAVVEKVQKKKKGTTE